MKNYSIIVLIITVGLLSPYGCQNKREQSTPSKAGASQAISAQPDEPNQYQLEITSMRDRIRRNVSSNADMLRLCERLLNDPNVQHDSLTLAGILFTYGFYLVGENQFDQAVVNLEKVKSITASSQWPDKMARLANIDVVIAKAYKTKKDYDPMVSLLKHMIDDYQGLDGQTSQGAMPEYHSFFAVMDLGLYYAQTKQFNEGITYLTTLTQRYPDTRTAFAAQTYIYNLQMASGDTLSAATMKMNIDEKLNTHPDYKNISANVLDFWGAKRGNQKAAHLNQ